MSLTTILTHSSGEYISQEMSVPVTNLTHKAQGQL
jgi:hypothetical protein